jgi:O-antigen ligase
MTRERIDSLCERGILALVLIILCFGPLATGAVRTVEFLIVQALTVGALALWFIRLWWGRLECLLCPPVCWPILAFALYAIGMYVTADIEYVARWELLRVLVYTALFFVVLNNLQRQESVQIISFTVLGVALLVTFVAVWQYLARADRVPTLGAWIESCLFSHKTWYIHRIYLTRASGTYVNPNHLAGFLEMLLPLALAYTLVGRGRALRKVFLGYVALALVVGIGVSVSRGSWIATTGVLLLFFAILAIYRNLRVPSLVMMFLVITGATFFIAKTEFFQRRFQDLFARGLEQDTRVQLWDSTVQMWQDHFWTGVGPGHFDFRFRKYRPEEIQLRPDRAHNEFLNLLADWGVVGTSLVLLALLCLFIGVIQTWRHLRRSDRDLSGALGNRFAFLLGTFLGLLAVLAHSAVDFNMQIPANAILVFCFAALLSSQLRHATDRFWVRPGALHKVVVSLPVLLFMAYGSAQLVRLAREYRWLILAEAEPWRSLAEIDLNQKAFAAEPMNFDTAWTIADAYQKHSAQGGEDNAILATNAITWYARGMQLNPYEARNHSGSGWCWDWLALRQDELAGLHELAERAFMQAEGLDPKGYTTLTEVGYHFVQAGNYAAARLWFERSLRLLGRENDTAIFYYPFCNQKLAESATNQSSLIP